MVTEHCASSTAESQSDSLRPHGLLPTRLLCPWDFPGKNTGVGCHALLQGIFPALGLQADSLPLGRPTQHHGCTQHRRIRHSKCLIPCYVHPPGGGPPRPPSFSPWGFRAPSFLLRVHLFTEPPFCLPRPPSAPGEAALGALSAAPQGEMRSELLSSRLSRAARPRGGEKERDPLGGAPVRNRRGLPWAAPRAPWRVLSGKDARDPLGPAWPLSASGSCRPRAAARRLPRPRASPGKGTGAGCRALLQRASGPGIQPGFPGFQAESLQCGRAREA